ncbi:MULTISPECIES: phosphoadenylyl-sulfate reductase [unclassified Neptuniibacter]|uniref:phosphoadenylyl-sulfate reductase n=1 Tax=unclassified Neptuniibacter TaxID=2630693 RepID=UPI0026E2C3F9|nr:MULTISPECIES: phosphoadenylyl-sulfate reductase [unclassified Neptuniibacter]MDO6512775.1 phosphoadenylyl-sulfate reductase [Neptuniibacter sp. 2_MG-2023]MDO6593041.1 phosphoadenylyl-sulfate reductase [Neptuniibacter sp. 1_MG-2023]
MSEQISSELQSKVIAAAALLNKGLSDYDGSIVFANSLGAEDVVIADLISKNCPNIRNFVLDTGRLPEETLKLLTDVQAHYPNLKVDVYYPESADVEGFVAENGVNAFYESQALRKGCCFVRKIKPLKRALADKKAWITGLRREQSVTRDEIQFEEWDEGNNMHKLNPLADWSEKEVWAYIKANNVPYNELHDKHYPSIGCAPCTRAISMGEDVRSGRWWWENPENRECGLHPATPLNFKN